MTTPMKHKLLTTSLTLILDTAAVIGFAQDGPAASTTSNTTATVRGFIDDEVRGGLGSCAFEIH
jgi:hypothetical protein